MAAIQYKDARQDIRLVPAETALEDWARGSGRGGLGLGDEIGAIEAGKRADPRAVRHPAAGVAGRSGIRSQT